MLFHIFEKINNNLETSTISEYKEIINICKDIYLKKSKDYGSAWRILRTTSLTDQIFIKAQRIRSTQEKKKMKVDEKIENEFNDNTVTIKSLKGVKGENNKTFPKENLIDEVKKLI